MMAGSCVSPATTRAMAVWRKHFKRWFAFNAVGVLGSVVQIVALILLRQMGNLHYMAAAAVAVEAAILNNFLWHERWTWADRRRKGGGSVITRWLKFNLTNGMVSMVGNLLLMRLLVGTLKLNYIVANLAAITVCSVLNFAMSDRFVFTRSRMPG